MHEHTDKTEHEHWDGLTGYRLRHDSQDRIAWDYADAIDAAAAAAHERDSAWHLREWLEATYADDSRPLEPTLTLDGRVFPINCSLERVLRAVPNIDRCLLDLQFPAMVLPGAQGGGAKVNDDTRGLSPRCSGTSAERLLPRSDERRQDLRTTPLGSQYENSDSAAATLDPDLSRMKRQIVGANAASGDGHQAKYVSRFALQEVAILTELERAGHTPNALPKNQPRCPGVKAAIRTALNTHPLFKHRPKVFEHAWQRLREDRRICDVKSEPIAVALSWKSVSRAK